MRETKKKRRRRKQLTTNLPYSYIGVVGLLLFTLSPWRAVVRMRTKIILFVYIHIYTWMLLRVSYFIGIDVFKMSGIFRLILKHIRSQYVLAYRKWKLIKYNRINIFIIFIFISEYYRIIHTQFLLFFIHFSLAFIISNCCHCPSAAIKKGEGLLPFSFFFVIMNLKSE